MKRVQYWQVVIIVAGLMAGGLVFNCLSPQASAEASAVNTSQVVPFTIGTSFFQGGDSITIDEIDGTTNTFMVGNVYQIKGTYNLVSQAKAYLAAEVAADQGFSPKHAPIDGTQPFEGTNQMMVEKGQGRFALVLRMTDEGSPHLSFYQASGARERFASVNFTHRKHSSVEMSHVVHFVVNRTQMKGPDGITISEIRGTSDEIAANNVYEIKGSYRLASRESATLSTAETIPSTEVIHSRGLDDTEGPRKMEVSRGEGRFTLFLYMRAEGDAHLSFYGSDGPSFGSVYFSNR